MFVIVFVEPRETSTPHTQRPEASGSLPRYALVWLKFFEEILPSESPDSWGDGLRRTFRLRLLMNQKHVHHRSLEAQTCQNDSGKVLYHPNELPFETSWDALNL